MGIFIPHFDSATIGNEEAFKTTGPYDVRGFGRQTDRFSRLNPSKVPFMRHKTRILHQTHTHTFLKPVG
ncbi:MAG: hypothetical protein CMJ74_07970 [Planctomycetaceae bacterium]|nr:hypothetical protein [Planctomycetaceae bacterium]